jgi:hypothetical protein
MRACAVLKAAEYSMLNVEPVIVATGEDMREAGRVEDALTRLQELGDQNFAHLPTPEQRFAAAFAHPKNRALAEAAHSRPQANAANTYPMPRVSHTEKHVEKRDGVTDGSAYRELQAKAAELRKAHPELSEAQAFTKVYSDPGNRDLAKRERAESAPR